MKFGKHTNSIIALRDPFMKLESVSKLIQQLPTANPYESPTKEEIDLIYNELSDYCDSMEQRHSLVWFELVPSAPLTIRGVVCALPNESTERNILRERWRKVLVFERNIERSSPEDFEILGRTILHWYGLKNPLVTKRSGDGGLDFIGEGLLGDLAGRPKSEWTVIDSCKFMFVGQAKKYNTIVIGTPELRDIIGSVALMQRDSYRSRYGYQDYNWSLLQPRILMFITTSRFSADAIKLAEEAGIILADRDQILKIYYSRLLAFPDE